MVIIYMLTLFKSKSSFVLWRGQTFGCTGGGVGVMDVGRIPPYPLVVQTMAMLSSTNKFFPFESWGIIPKMINLFENCRMNKKIIIENIVTQ